MKRFMNKKVAVVGVTVALVLGLGGAAFAFFTSTGTGTGAATIGSASPLTVTLGHGLCSSPVGPTASLTPCLLVPTALGDTNAAVETVPYTVTNPGEGNVGLTTVIMEVTPGWTYTDGAGDPACTAADFSINGQAVGTPAAAALNVTLKSHSDAPANAYTGNFTVQMVDNGLNQDSCAGGSVPLTVTANPTTSPTNANVSIEGPDGSGGWQPNPSYLTLVTEPVGTNAASLTVTAIQPNTVNPDGTFTLTYDNTFLTYTGEGDTSGICTTPVASGDSSTVSCSYTDISHGDTSKPFTFTTLQTTGSGTTVVTAVVTITGSGTATQTFPLIIS